ncbi:hypothetical protein I4U23_012603 [Adineta vaga]|nr:hypothetical protein I4U23_012603 [Adineta vaga]
MNDGINKHEDGSSSNNLSRTTIREANNHLQMLHKRNQDLEELVVQQKDDLQRKDFEYRNLFQANQLLEKHCQQLQFILEDRTRRLQMYEKKEVLFRETLELKPAIESLLDVLNTFEKEDSNQRLHFQRKHTENEQRTDAV